MYLKYSYKIIIYYFFFSVVSAILRIWHVDLQFDKVLDVAIILIMVSSKWGKFRTIDYLIIAYMGYQLFTVIINDYPNKAMITYYAIKTTWIPIMLFFVGQKKVFATNEFYEKMIIPVSISLIFGIVFFITMPNWYISMRNAFLFDNAPEDLINELFRMSSFWPAPQFIGYSTFVLYTYLLNSIYRSTNTKSNKYKLLILVLCLLSIFLIQLRVVIVGCAIATLFFIVWNIFYGNNKKNIYSFYVVVLLGLLVVFLFTMSSLVNIDFLSSKIVSIFNFQDTTSERVAAMYDVRTLKIHDINFLGHGMGRFSITAAQFKMPDLRDGGYLKELLESGYLGFSLFAVAVIFTSIRVVRNIKYMPFEFVILIFYLIALIGANCISESFLLNIVFWLNLGRIWNNNLLKNLKFNYAKTKNNICNMSSHKHLPEIV